MDDAVLRKSLADLLEGGNAHVAPEAALKGVNLRLSTVRPEGMAHSVWELLEHIRLAQEDILRYTLDPGWKSPEWPEGYWPENPSTVTEKKWKESVSAFFADLAGMVELAKSRDRDLTAKIPHGEGRTYLRQILLAADHSAYHFGQLVLVRKALGNWEG